MVVLLLHASIVFAQEAAIDTKNILVLDGGPWSSRYKTEFYSVFTNEFLDLSSAGCCVTYRFLDDNNYLQSTPETQELRLLATRYRIDLIVAIELTANAYLLRDPQGLFIDTPKLALFPSASLYSKLTAREDFQIVVRNGRERSRDTINHIFNLLPLTQHLYVVSGPSEGDVELQVGARQLLSERDGLDINDLTSIHFLNGLPLSDLTSQISELPPNSAILFLSYRGTENGRSVNSVDVVKQLHGITSAPIFASNRTLLGHGIMGGSPGGCSRYWS